jgi:hypothetical protein
VGIIFWELAHRSLTGEYAMPYSEYQELVFDFQVPLSCCFLSFFPL